jgi:two-component system response regulator HupR/HoxA
MKDPRSYLGLHTVSMLREVIRKWWQVDIGFADASGRLSDHSWGGAEPVPPAGNDFCRVMLDSPAGRRRCLSSVREIHRLLRPGTRARGRLLHSCHLGLQMAASPVYARGQYRGFVFACGFSSRELSRTRITRLRGAVQDTISGKDSLRGERVPVLGREDIERLKDLLAYGAGEMAAFEEELTRREQASFDQARVSFEGIVHRSPNMAEVLSRLKKMSPSSSPILLVGEPGAGKRVLARAVALSGPRRSNPFVVFAGSPDAQAAETRLFGQVRGGPLGKVGVLESAQGGTVYLHPDSWLFPTVQVKLLRLVQEGTLVPVGSGRPAEADVRLLLGLHREPEEEAARGQLRRDLADWLAPYRIDIPPLRERLEDIGALSDLFIRQYLPEGKPPPALHPESLSLFMRYRWPGNAAELKEEIRSLLALSPKDGVLPPEHVSLRIRESVGGTSQALARALDDSQSLKQAVEILERQIIHEGLIRTRGNKSHLSRQLGISRSNLLKKLVKYGLDRTPPPEE